MGKEIKSYATTYKTNFCQYYRLLALLTFNTKEK
jgi:hypothetical protein